MGRRAGVKNSFPEHNSTTVRNSVMVLGIYNICKCGVLHARKTTMLVFIL